MGKNPFRYKILYLRFLNNALQIYLVTCHCQNLSSAKHLKECKFVIYGGIINPITKSICRSVVESIYMNHKRKLKNACKRMEGQLIQLNP